MEHDSGKPKEKKISVKIGVGSIWEDLKENLRECYVEEKKYPKKGLLVEINVKRLFRAPANLSQVKDEGWLNKLKCVLIGGSKAPGPSQPTKVKQVEKKVRPRETDRTHLQDFSEEKSHNALAQAKKRSSSCRNKEQVTDDTHKLKKGDKSVPDDTETKKNSKESCKSFTCKGEQSGETTSGLKSTRQKGNKYEVQIDNRVATISPDDSEEEVVERIKFVKDKRSKSKPATAKEKWNQSAIGKNIESGTELTMETIKTLKSLVFTMKAVDKNLKNKDKEKAKEVRNKYEEEKRSGQKEEEKQSDQEEEENEEKESDEKSADSLKPMKECNSQEKKTRKGSGLQKLTKEDKDSSNKEEKDDTEHGARSSSSATDIADLSTSVKIWDSPGEEEQACGDSSYCCSGSSCSEELCCCGCMDNVNSNGGEVSSSSSSSSLEYLRSYSGNLIMCSRGKKPVLSQHIRYLSSGIKL